MLTCNFFCIPDHTDYSDLYFSCCRWRHGFCWGYGLSSGFSTYPRASICVPAKWLKKKGLSTKPSSSPKRGHVWQHPLALLGIGHPEDDFHLQWVPPQLLLVHLSGPDIHPHKLRQHTSHSISLAHSSTAPHHPKPTDKAHPSSTGPSHLVSTAGNHQRVRQITCCAYLHKLPLHDNYGLFMTSQRSESSILQLIFTQMQLLLTLLYTLLNIVLSKRSVVKEKI